LKRLLRSKLYQPTSANFPKTTHNSGSFFFTGVFSKTPHSSCSFTPFLKESP